MIDDAANASVNTQLTTRNLSPRVRPRKSEMSINNNTSILDRSFDKEVTINIVD
jgi:hypothetical protein